MRIPTFAMYERQAGQVAQEYDDYGKMLQKAMSGKKLVNSSDDPVLASQIKSKQQFVDNLQSYFENGALATNHASLLTKSSQNAVNIVSEVQVLLKKAQSGI